MKAVIHVGTHKTASTSFQLTASACSAFLLKNGIYYEPAEPGPGHHLIAWDMMRGIDSGFRRLIERGLASVGRNAVILISSEDFEGVLENTSLARRMEEILQGYEIGEIYWVAVHRDPYQYFESLYCELSKHRGIVIGYRDMANKILDRGLLRISSQDIAWTFIFDYKKFFASFQSSIQGRFCTCTLDRFTAGICTGQALLDFCYDLAQSKTELMRLDEAEILAAMSGEKILANTRLQSYEVEINYALSSLGMVSDGDSTLAEKCSRPLIRLIAAERLLEKSLSSSIVKDLFFQRYVYKMTEES